MKTTKIYISLFFLTFFSTLCFAQESEISINEEENKTTTVNQNTLLAPPFAIQIHQSTNIAEANKIKSEAKRNFPGMSTKLKSNQKHTQHYAWQFQQHKGSQPEAKDS